MSLTETDPEKFFEEYIVPLADEYQTRSGGVFPLSADAQAETYYCQRKNTRLKKADFLLPSFDAPDQLSHALHILWSTPRDASLRALAPHFAALAASLANVEAQEADLSPYLYVMF